VKVLDRIVTRVAREIRLLEQALKTTNAKTPIEARDCVKTPASKTIATDRRV